MLHTYYYVDGKRVNMEQYFAACENNAYRQEALKKAIEYFKRNPWEWRYLCNAVSGTPHPSVLISHFDMTPEGRAFRKEWDEKMKKQNKIDCTLAFFIFLIPVIVGILMALT